jgi:hypothetical protein
MLGGATRLPLDREEHPPVVWACFLLLSLGIGGASIGNLAALEPYWPVFIALVSMFLWLTFRQRTHHSLRTI